MNQDHLKMITDLDLGSNPTLIDYDGPAKFGKRIRKLTNWKVCHDPGGMVYLSGETVEEADGAVIGRKRFTTTSHIASIQGRIATTLSGSQYTLLIAHKEQVDGVDPAFTLKG